MIQKSERPDLTGHTLNPAEFPQLDLTATVRRTNPDGSPVNLPRYYPAWTGGSVGAGDIDSGRIMPPVLNAQETEERSSGMSLPYRDVPLIG